MAFEAIQVSNQSRIPNKKFGILFAIFFTIGALFTYFKGEILLTLVQIICIFILVALALFSPSTLYYPNQIWHQLATVLGKISNPIILGMIYLLVLTPVAIILRVLRRDVLMLHSTPNSFFRMKNRSLNEEFDFKKQY